MVEIADWLEEIGYIRRARDNADHRRYVVTITDKGQQTRSQIVRAVESFDEQFFEPLSAGEMSRLANLLAKLYSRTGEFRGEGVIGGIGLSTFG